MAVAKRMFPTAFISPRSTFNIVLLSEGFTANSSGVSQPWQEDHFVSLCHEFLDVLRNTAPFNVLRYQQGGIAVWRHFIPSAVAGPALGTTPGNSAFRSTYDQATGALSLDQSLVATTLNSLDLPEPDGGNPLNARWLTHGYSIYSGLIVFLLPGTVGSTQISVDHDTRSMSGWVDLHFVVTSADGRWQRVIIWAIARGLGLGEEYVLSDPTHAAAGQSDTYALNLRPNLFAFVPSTPSAPPFTGPPPKYFKWYSELDAAARAKPLTVVRPNQSSATPDEPIQLFEGGGGYQTNVFRSAADCMMRRMISAGAASPKADEAPFCTICERYLLRVLTGTTRRSEKKSLQDQKLAFDEVGKWNAVEKITSGFPLTRVARGATTQPGPWWEYDAKVGAGYNGLWIERLKLKGQTASTSGEDVAELIEFRDITVTFNNVETRSFDFAAAFAAATHPPIFLNATDGTVDDLSTRCLRGLKLTLEDDFGGDCRIQIELSLLLKAEAADIDPGEQVFAAKLYPQIALTWFPTGKKAVTGFRGCIRMVCNNAVQSNPNTLASFFVDTNFRAPGTRRIASVSGNPLLLDFPSWTMVFDYHYPNVQNDVEVYAVYGPKAPPAKRKFRTKTYTWPPSTSTSIVLEKVPDQGMYDNLHIHGDMGTDQYDPNQGPMVHAPGCAEACLHLHWRWGVLAAAPATVSSLMSDRFYNFWGWTRPEKITAVAYDLPRMPLVPPNQDVWVALTHPNTTRSNPSGPVVTASRSLDPRRKAIWYTVDISGPAAYQPQVILEQGISFAYKYNFDSSLLRISLGYIRWLLQIPDTTPDQHVIHLMYSFIRWFFNSDGTTLSAQIPEGTETAGGMKMEDL